MADFAFVPLGVGNAFSASFYSSCLLLRASGKYLLIDCPHPIRKILRESTEPSGWSLDIGDISGLVLTHLHADHASGLEMYGFFCHYALQARARLFTHPEVAAHLWQGHLAASMEWSIQQAGESPCQRKLGDFFDLNFISERDGVRFGPFQIECRRTVHSLPTFALRIRAGQRTLGYSADTAFDAGLVEWLAAADTIVHETGESGLHTPYADLAALPEELRCKMRLIHYADDFDTTGSAIEPLQQGRLYDV